MKITKKYKISISYYEIANKRFLLLLWIHLPLMLLTAYLGETSLQFALIGSLIILTGPTLFVLTSPSGLLASISNSVAIVCFSALLIHLSGGMTEMHFHIFSALGLLIMLAEPIAIAAALLVVVVHHLAFFFVIPASLINYQAGFGILLIHAFFALAIGIPAILISKKFKLYIISVREMIEKIQEISQIINTSSDNVLRVSDTLSRSTSDEATAVTQTAASLEKLNEMIIKNSENANSTRLLSHAAVARSSDGIGCVAKISASFTEIQSNGHLMAKSVNDNNNQLSGIIALINEIENKTKIINDIVFQTKLLSFNASVEAARAGEHGKGFAVVAEEVGNLAQMSGNAAKEITNLLDGSISKVKTIISETKSKVAGIVEDGKLKIENGIFVTKSCKVLFTDSSESVSNINNMTIEIATACQEQALRSSEISKAMDEITRATQSNSEVAQESSKLAKALAQGSQALNNSLIKLLQTVEG